MDPRPYEHLKVEFADGVITVELDRPEKRNAINLVMAKELHRVVEEHAYRTDARVLVFKGAGSSFCAGFDVSTDFAQQSLRERWLEASVLTATFEAIAAAPVVKVAQLQGHVVGAGLILATVCELRYATSTARFFVPELDMGIPFSLGGVSQLAKFVGLTRTADMVLNCTSLAADHPDAGKLISELVPADNLDARVREVSARLAARPSSLVLATLSALRQAGDDLVSPPANDLLTMFFTQDDSEAAAVNRAYAKHFSRAG